MWFKLTLKEVLYIAIMIIFGMNEKKKKKNDSW